MTKRVFLNLIFLRFSIDDLTFIVTELDQLTSILRGRAMQAYNLGLYEEYLSIRSEANRCDNIAKAIAMAGRLQNDDATE